MNEKSRITNSIRNVSVGMIGQVVQIILGFVSRTLFIKYLAIEYLGVNSLFSNILSMLSMAELGLASAFIYALYKPLSEGNKTEIATIVKFYKKTYFYVAVFIFVTGLALIPFLSDIIPQKPIGITEDLRLIYFIFLFNTASSYLFSYKISLLDADQKISVATQNSIKFSVSQIVLQIIVLVLTQNFILFLLTQLVTQFASNWYISRIVDRQYPFLAENNHLQIDKKVKSKIISNVKATFYTKIGGVLVNGTDNLFINYFVGLAVLGKYSNYVLLIGMVSSFVMIIFANLKSSIANVVVQENKQKQQEIFATMNFLNFWIFGVCAIIFVFTLEDFISLWIGSKFLLPLSIPLLLATNFFMMGMQNSFWTFKVSYGFFQEGKFMVLGTAFLNLIFSYFLGKEYGISGVLLATIIARLLTNFWYDPYIVLKKGLKISPLKFALKFSKYLAILLIAFVILYSTSLFLIFSPMLNLLIKLILSFFITNILIYIVFGQSSEFRSAIGYFTIVLNKLKLR